MEEAESMTDRTFGEADKNIVEFSQEKQVSGKVRDSPHSRIEAHPRLWSIILTGGNGDRLSAPISRW